MGGGDGTMSFMVCTSNETGKSLAGVFAEGSRMLGQVMGGHASGCDRRNSRTHGHAAAGPEAIRAPSHHSGRATPQGPFGNRINRNSRESVLGTACSWLAPVLCLSFTGLASALPAWGYPGAGAALVPCASLVHQIGRAHV